MTNPENLKDYIPISLVGSLYKILAKLLSLSLRGIMNQVIDDSQCTFVQDRHILDGVLVANEAITWLRKKKTKVCSQNLTSKVHMIQLVRELLIKLWKQWVLVPNGDVGCRPAFQHPISQSYLMVLHLNLLKWRKVQDTR